MDTLEEFIKNNRRHLDKYDPPTGVMKRVLQRVNFIPLMGIRLIRVAAVFLVLTATAFSFYYLGQKRKGSELESLSSPDSSPAFAQFRETENYYKNSVNALFRQAAPLLTSNPDIKKEYSQDIAHLDSIYLDIRKDLKDNVANQDVIEALIRNYRIRISLLEDMLNRLEGDKHNEKLKHNEI